MASAPSSTLHAKSITGRTSDRSPDFHSKVEFWWVDIPCSLARYSRLLAAAWSDGLYLTSWRRVALALPLASFMLGFLKGATHWSPLTIGSTHVSTSIPAVAFLQIYHLLFLAAALGALSAQLGLVLVTGFALGDYLIAGPYMTQWSWAPISGFLTMRVPMLLSYCMFFALAVMPTLFGRALLTPLRRQFPRDDVFSVILRVAASAIVQMLLVFCWIEVTPVVLRVMWSWVRQVPILGVSDYRDMLSPWLPLAAGIGVVARAILVRRTCARADLTERMARLFEGRRQAEREARVDASPARVAARGAHRPLCDAAGRGIGCRLVAGQRSLRRAGEFFAVEELRIARIGLVEEMDGDRRSGSDSVSHHRCVGRHILLKPGDAQNTGMVD